MPRRLPEYALFLREFVRNFHTTGAILPSGRWLARALTRYVRQPAGPRRILEVGPGTGAVTRRLVTSLQPQDELDLVELNPAFVKQLEHRFQVERAFRDVAPRTRILSCAVEALPNDTQYDLIISGLPLNNFSVATVEAILHKLTTLLKPAGTLSFFEYIAVRRAKTLVSMGPERVRLRGIDRALRRVLDGGLVKRDWVWPNVPPAWVHHVRLDGQHSWRDQMLIAPGG